MKSGYGVFDSTPNTDISYKTSVNTSSGGSYIPYLSFDASKSNSIYGNSNSVQPYSIYLVPIIKY